MVLRKRPQNPTPGPQPNHQTPHHATKGPEPPPAPDPPKNPNPTPPPPPPPTTRAKPPQNPKPPPQATQGPPLTQQDAPPPRNPPDVTARALRPSGLRGAPTRRRAQTANRHRRKKAPAWGDGKKPTPKEGPRLGKEIETIFPGENHLKVKEKKCLS